VGSVLNSRCLSWSMEERLMPR